MNLFLDVSCNGIKKQYESSQKKQYETTNNSGGFIDKKTEKKYKRVLKSWHDMFIKNKHNSSIINAVNEATIKTEGNVIKDKKFLSILNNSNDIMKKIKNHYRKDLPEYSAIGIYNDIASFLTNQKFINQIKEAYKEFNKSKTDEYNLSHIFILFHQIMTSYIIVSAYTINSELYIAYGYKDHPDSKDFIKSMNDIQKSNKGIVGDIGFAAIEFLYTFKGIKNIKEEINKIKSINEESMKKIKKGHESADIAIKQNIYYDISNKGYLVDRTHNFGNEDAIMISLIIVGSIIGLVASLSLIRRAIYTIGTIKTDIMQYIGVDVITITMNIEELKQKLENTTDPKERKKIQAIIDKQQKFVDMCTKKRNELTDEVNETISEAEYIVEQEDHEDEREIENSNESPSSSNDEYDILM